MNNNNSSIKIFITDNKNVNDNKLGLIFLWSSFSKKNKKNIFSIPDYIQDNDESIKNKYLNWVDSIGFKVLNQKSIFEKLKIRNDFSYWVMTGFVQKKHCFVSPDEILNVIKFIAFEEMIDKLVISEIELELSNQDVIKIFVDFAKKKNIKINKKNFNKFHINLNPFFAILKAIVWFLLHIYNNKKNVFKKIEFKKTNYFLFDYFDNFDKELIKKNIYKSYYWNNLPDKLAENNNYINWMHLRVENKPSNYEKFKSENTKHIHTIFDHHLNFRVYIRSFFDYVTIVFNTLLIKDTKSYFTYKNFNFYNLIKKDLYDSTYGITTVNNCIYFNGFEEVFKKNSKQKLGIYLQENLPFESALIYNWKKFNHGFLIGFAHTTVKFWDLRYFYSNRQFSNDNYIQQPNYIAVTGKTSLENLVNFGFKKDQIFLVEGLRYLHLLNHHDKKVNTCHSDKKRILVIGGYDFDETNYMFDCLNEIRKDKNKIFYFKPHPNFQNKNNKIDLTGFYIYEDQLTISNINNNFDYVFVSNSSSASIEISYCDVEMAISVDPSKLNMSPFYKNKNVIFIKNQEDISFFLERNKKNSNIINSQFILLDNNLKLWLHLIKEIND